MADIRDGELQRMMDLLQISPPDAVAAGLRAGNATGSLTVALSCKMPDTGVV